MFGTAAPSLTQTFHIEIRFRANDGSYLPTLNLATTRPRLLPTRSSPHSNIFEVRILVSQTVLFRGCWSAGAANTNLSNKRHASSFVAYRMSLDPTPTSVYAVKSSCAYGNSITNITGRACLRCLYTHTPLPSFTLTYRSSSLVPPVSWPARGEV